MKTIVVYEENQRDLEKLRMLDEYIEGNYIYTSLPSEALTNIQETDADVFICAFETKAGHPLDLIESVVYGAPMTKIILTSSFDDIPGLLHCINRNAIFRTVRKPFLNTRDLVEALRDSLFSADPGVIGDLEDEKLLLGADASAFWQPHDRRLDWDLIRVWSGCRRGLCSESPEQPLSDEVFRQDLFSSYLGNFALNPCGFPIFSERFREMEKADDGHFLDIQDLPESFSKEDGTGENGAENDWRLPLLVYCCHRMLKYSFASFRAAFSVRERENHLLCSLTLGEHGPLTTNAEDVRMSALHILQAVFPKVACGEGEKRFDFLCLFQADETFRTL